jgi:hypothetical protein
MSLPPLRRRRLRNTSVTLGTATSQIEGYLLSWRSALIESNGTDHALVLRQRRHRGLSVLLYSQSSLYCAAVVII